MKGLSTTVALVALVASFSFADGHMTTHMDYPVRTDGGSWQGVDGEWAQTDASAGLANAWVPAGIQGKAEYTFDVAYIGGLEDDAIGFGAIIPGFEMRLVWDPATLGGSGLHAQVYNAEGEIHEYAGIRYDFEVPASNIAGITAETVRNTPLTVRIRMDYSNGNVWVNNPFDRSNDQSNWWAISFDPSFEGDRHNMIGVSTTSAAVTFSNLEMNDNLVFDREVEIFAPPLYTLSFDSDRRKQIYEMSDSFAVFDKDVSAINANEDALSTLEEAGIDSSDLRATSDALSTFFAAAIDHDADHDADTLDLLSNISNYVDSRNSVSSGDIVGSSLGREASIAPAEKPQRSMRGRIDVNDLIDIIKKIDTIMQPCERGRAAVKVQTFRLQLQDDDKVSKVEVKGLSVHRAKSDSDLSKAVRFSKFSPTSKECITIGRWDFWACDSHSQDILTAHASIDITQGGLLKGAHTIELSMLTEPNGKCLVSGS